MIKLFVFNLLFLPLSVAFGQDKVKGEDFIKSIDRGVIVYEDFCINCHLPDGKGVKGVTPPLALSDYLMKDRVIGLKVVKFGQSGEITVNGEIYNGTMTSMGLSDKEIADVMNYITNSFGNSINIMFTEEEVLKIEQ